MQTPRRIQNHHVVTVLLRVLNRRLREIDRLVLITHGENVHMLLFAVYL